MSSNANKTVTLTVDVQAKLSDLQGQVKKMQEMLGGLKMPEGLTQSTAKAFDNIFERLKNLQNYTESNKMELIDKKKVQSEFNAIHKDFKSLVGNLNRQSSKIKLVDAKEYNTIKNALNQYDEGIKQATNDLKKQRDQVQELLKDYNKLRENVKNKTYARDAAKNNVEAVEAEIKAAIENYKKGKENDGKSHDWLGDPERVKQYFGMTSEAMKLYNKLAAAQEDLTKKNAALETAEGKVAEARETNKLKAKEMVETLNQLKANLESISSAELEKIKNDLFELQQKGEIKLNFDPRAIKSTEELYQKLEEIDAQDFTNITEKLKQFGIFVDNTSNEADKLGESVNKDTEAFEELDGALEAFKKKATYFFGMTNAVNLLRRAVRSAYDTVKDLDKVMTETAVVTDFSVGDMWAQLPEYTKRANELGVSIHDAYEAATLYYQQGLKTNEVIAVSNETLKMARIAGLGAAEATDRMTNALRGFNMEINEESAQRVNDVYSKLAAITAADTDEISTAMTKVASLAHNANMEFETTSAFLSQMIETTRESAETAGTALKTVIARFSEVKKLYNQGDLMGTDEEGEEIDVNKVSQALRSAGINLNEYLTGAKGLDDIFIELAGKWEHLDMVQQRYIATMAAGSRQQSRFIAMMSDYDRTMQLVDAANTSAGASQKQFEKTLDSLQSKLAQLKNSWDTFLMGVADDRLIKVVIDALTKFIDLVNKLFEITDNIPIGGSIARIMAIVGALKLGKIIIDKTIVSVGLLTGVTKKQAEAEIASAAATRNKTEADSQQLVMQQKSLLGAIKYAAALKIESKEKATTALRTYLLNKEGQKSIVVKKALAKVTNVETASYEELRNALVSTVAQYAAMAVAAGLVIYAFKKLIDVVSRDPSKERLEELTEATQAASTAADDAANAYNNLKDSLSGIAEKYDTIETLTRGTQEWRDAVKEVNNEVLDLMATYKEAKVENENGILKITNMDTIKDIASQRYSTAQATLLGLQRETIKAQNQVDVEELGNKIASSLSVQNVAQMRMSGTTTKDIYNQILEDAKNGKFSGSDERVRQELEKSYKGQITITDDLVQSLKRYGQALDENAAKIDSYNSALANIVISNADLANGTEEAVQNFLSSERMDALFNEAYKQYSFNGFASDSIVESLLLNELGYTNKEQYEEKTGKKLTGESARVQLAQTKAQKEATHVVEDFSKSFKKLPPIIQKIYSSKDGLGLTREEAVEGSNGFSLKRSRNGSEEQREAEIQKLKDAAKQVWDDMGELQKLFGSYDVFEEEYVNSITNVFDATNDVREKFVSLGFTLKELKENFAGVDKILSADILKSFGNNLDVIFKASGEQGVKEITYQVRDIIKNNNMGLDEIKTFVKTLDSIDWYSIDSLETLKDALDANDIQISDEELNNLTSDIIELGNASKKVDLEKITEQLEKVGNLVFNLRSGKQGATGWSKEDMEKAVEAGINRSDFWYDFDTQTYTYIGNNLEKVADIITANADKLFEAPDLEKKIANGEIFKQLNGSDIKDDGSTSLKELKDFLLTYADKATDLSRDEVLQAGNSVEKLKGYFEEIKNNADHIGEYTDTLNDLKHKEEEFVDGQKSILENADAGNWKAVKAQAEKYEVPEEIRKLYQLTGKYQQLAKIGDVYRQAGELGFDKEELSNYAKELKKINPLLSEVETHQIALFNTKQNDGLKKLVDSYENWTALIKEDGTLMDNLDKDSAKALSDMKKATEEMLNVSKPLSDAFYKDTENLQLLKEAAEGSVEAFTKLQIAAGEDYLISVGVDVNDDQVRTQLGELETWLLQNSPDLKVGAYVDDQEFINSANNLIREAGLTTKEIQTLFNNIGYDPNVTTKKITIPNPSYSLNAGLAGLATSLGGGLGVAAGIPKYIDLDFPVITGGKYIGNNKNGPSFSSKGSGSGSGGSGKTDTWENPYDELYNLTEKINESLRTREALERRYEKLVKKTASTVGEVTKAYYDQIRQLRTEADLQYQMQAGRARQLNNVGNEYYMDSEGNRSTFSSLGVTKYASYDQKTGLLQIDWSGLEALEGDPNKVEEGKAAEAYISRLEELQDQFEEVRDKLWDIEDQIEQLREEAIENYLTFEDRVMDALVDSYQRQIDEYSTLSDQIKEQTDAIIKGIQDDVALSRQIRDNTKKEEDIADKEARLAYLRRDTSGANALEIKKLEDEIANARESYSDTMVDQQIQQLQDDANNAAEQRQHQIDIMQNQLDVAKENGTLWGEVWDLINTATAADGTFSQNTELVTLLEESEAYQSLSKIGQMKWWEEVAEAFKRAQVGLSEAEDKYGVDANGDGKVTSSGTSSAISSTAAMSSTQASGGSAATSTSSSSAVSTAGSGHFAKVGAYEHPMAQMPAKEVSELQQALNAAGFTDNDGKKLAVDGKYGSRTRAAVYKLQQKLGNVRVDGYYGPETRKATLQSQFKAYKTGGLADYTGPAWLDGSKTHPELVLNAKDTENFIELKNILANSFGTHGAGGINSGDTYYEFNIDAELGSDYDVEKLADKIKRLIYNDSSYRNVNSINFMR